MMSQMTPVEKARQIATLRHRMAQVATLQRQHAQLKALPIAARQSLDIAIQFARLDSALRIARQALARSLYSLPASERSRFIKMHASLPSFGAQVESLTTHPELISRRA